MDWSGRRLLFSGGGVVDTTLGERGRFLRGGPIYWERRSLEAALVDLFFAASLSATRGCLHLMSRACLYLLRMLSVALGMICQGRQGTGGRATRTGASFSTVRSWLFRSNGERLRGLRNIWASSADGPSCW